VGTKFTSVPTEVELEERFQQEDIEVSARADRARRGEADPYGADTDDEATATGDATGSQKHKLFVPEHMRFGKADKHRRKARTVALDTSPARGPSGPSYAKRNRGHSPPLGGVGLTSIFDGDRGQASVSARSEAGSDIGSAFTLKVGEAKPPEYWMDELNLLKVANGWNPNRQLNHARTCALKLPATNTAKPLLERRVRHAEACYALRASSLPKLTDDQYHVHVAAVAGLKLDWSTSATMAAFVRELEAKMLPRIGLVGALKMRSCDEDEFDFRAPTLGGMHLERDVEAAFIAHVLVER